MAQTSKAPLRLAGAIVNSGNINTGEQNMTFGGGISATFYSGIISGISLVGAPGAVCGVNTLGGSDVLVYSGAGRLKDVLIHQVAISGKSIRFYDSPTPTSGGPFQLSGHKVLGTVANSILSGDVGVPAGSVFAFDVPFTSGLCFNVTNNPPGFTVTYTPEANPPLVNPG